MVCSEPENLGMGHHFLQVNWDDLEVGRQVGSGRAYMAKWRETIVAVKVPHRTFSPSSLEEGQEALIDAYALKQLEKVRWWFASISCRVGAFAQLFVLAGATLQGVGLC